MLVHAGNTPSQARRFTFALLISTAAASSLAPTVRGDAPLDGSALAVLAVEAWNGAAHGKVELTIADGYWDGTDYYWTLPAPVTITDGQTPDFIGTLLSANVVMSFAEEFEIELDFGALAGAADTSFVVVTPKLNMDDISAARAQAAASVSMTLTDTGSGESSYAWVRSSGIPGTGMYSAWYTNPDGDATRFFQGLSQLFVSSGGTVTATQMDPQFGYRPVGEGVSEIWSDVSFWVTANDLVFGVTRFAVPEPPACPGDLTGDGLVDLDDLDDLLAHFGDCGTVGGEDINGDGCVNLSDLSLILSVFGADCDSSG